MGIKRVRVPIEIGVDLENNLIESGDVVDLDTVSIIVEQGLPFAEFDVEDKRRGDPGVSTALSISLVQDLTSYEAEFGEGDDRRVVKIGLGDTQYTAIIEFFEG